MRRFSALPVALVLAAAPLAAQQAPPPACVGSDYRQFDFWVGDWEVTDSAGHVVYGTNLVTREEGNCLVHEHWVGSRGGTGQSLNFYDPTRKYWQQVWVGNDGLILSITGGLAGNAMVLTGEAANPGGQLMQQRASWTPEPDGRVRQYWQQSSDGGKTWTVAFDGWYRPRKH